MALEWQWLDQKKQEWNDMQPGFRYLLIAVTVLGTAFITYNHFTRRPPRHAEAHVRAAELDLGVALIVQAASGARGDQPVLARPQGEVRHRRFVGHPRQRRIVHLVASHPLVQPPHMVLLRIAGKG